MLTPKQEQFVKKCKREGFNQFQVDQIYHGLEENGLSIKQVSLYASPEFNQNQMYEIRCGFCNDGLSIEQVKMYANPELNWEQMEKIRKVIKRYKNLDNLKTKIALMLLDNLKTKIALMLLEN